MSAIRLVAGFPASYAPHADFHLSQGEHRVAGLVVYAGGNIAVPTGASKYAAQARTSMGECTFLSNQVDFDATSITLIAEMLEEDGFYNFRLVEQAGTKPDEITLESRCKTPVFFKIWKPQSPFLMQHVAHSQGVISVNMARTWSVYAVVNGVTSAPVVTTNPNATITATQNSDNDGYFSLVIS